MNPLSWYVGFIGRLAKAVTRADNAVFFKAACSRMSGTVLNLGCGRSTFAKWLDGAREIRVDITRHQGVMVVCDAHALPFRKEAFTGVIMEEVLEHCRNPMLVSREVASIVVQGGRIALSVPFMFPMHDVPNDFFRFTRYGLESIWTESFSIVSLNPRLPGLETFAIPGVRLLHEKNAIKPLALISVPVSWLVWKVILRPLRFMYKGTFLAG